MIGYIKLEFQDELGKTLSAGIYNSGGQPIISNSKNTETETILNNALASIRKDLNSFAKHPKRFKYKLK